MTKKNAPSKISSVKIYKNGHFLECFTYFNTSNKKVKEKGEIQYMNKQIDIEEFKRRCENSEKRYISFTRRFNHG